MQVRTCFAVRPHLVLLFANLDSYPSLRNNCFEAKAIHLQKQGFLRGKKKRFLKSKSLILKKRYKIYQ